MPGGSKYMRHPFNSAGFPPEVRAAATSRAAVPCIGEAPPLRYSPHGDDCRVARAQILRIPSYYK